VSVSEGISTGFRIRATDPVDVFAYTVALCTFTQLVPQVLSESFLTSLTTAGLGFS